MNTAENEVVLPLKKVSLSYSIPGFASLQSKILNARSMMVSQTKSLTAHLTLRSKWNLSALKVRRQ